MYVHNKYLGELVQLADEARAELEKMQDIYTSAKRSESGVTLQTINEMNMSQDKLFQIMDAWGMKYASIYPRYKK